MVFGAQKQCGAGENRTGAVLAASSRQAAAQGVVADLRDEKAARLMRSGLYQAARPAMLAGSSQAGDETGDSSARRRPSAICLSKAFSETLSSIAPPQILGHSALGQRRVRSGDGAVASVYTSTRPGSPGSCRTSPC